MVGRIFSYNRRDNKIHTLHHFERETSWKEVIWNIKKEMRG
jgi:hypothetical protein